MGYHQENQFEMKISFNKKSIKLTLIDTLIDLTASPENYWSIVYIYTPASNPHMSISLSTKRTKIVEKVGNQSVYVCFNGFKTVG